MKIISKEEYEHACECCREAKAGLRLWSARTKEGRVDRKRLRARFKAESAIKRAYRRQESEQGVTDRARFLRNRNQRYSHYWRTMDRIIQAESPRACVLWERKKMRKFPECYLYLGLTWVLEAKVLPKW